MKVSRLPVHRRRRWTTAFGVMLIAGGAVFAVGGHGVDVPTASAGGTPARAGSASALLADLAPSEQGAVPTRLHVPGRHIDAPIVPVSLDAAGHVAVPPDVTTLGWFQTSPTPGLPGSSVIVGHVDYHGKFGPFFGLADVESGDIVTVDSADGSANSFAVTSVTRYVKSQLPVQQLFRRSGTPQLVLITCGGEFDPTRHTYEDNVVVIATPR